MFMFTKRCILVKNGLSDKVLVEWYTIGSVGHFYQISVQLWRTFGLMIIEKFDIPGSIAAKNYFFLRLCHTTSHYATPHPMNRARRWYTVVMLLYDLWCGLAICDFNGRGENRSPSLQPNPRLSYYLFLLFRYWLPFKKGDKWVLAAQLLEFLFLTPLVHGSVRTLRQFHFIKYLERFGIDISKQLEGSHIKLYNELWTFQHILSWINISKNEQVIQFRGTHYRLV